MSWHQRRAVVQRIELIERKHPYVSAEHPAEIRPRGTWLNGPLGRRPPDERAPVALVQYPTAATAGARYKGPKAYSAPDRSGEHPDRHLAGYAGFSGPDRREMCASLYPSGRCAGRAKRSRQQPSLN